MNKHFVLFAKAMLALLIGCVSIPSHAELSSEPMVVPRLRQWTGASGQWVLGNATRIVVDSDEFAATARQLASELYAESGLYIAVERNEAPRDGDIVLSKASDASLGAEGYELQIGPRVHMQAVTDTGAFYGTRTLLQMLRSDPTHRNLHYGHARDWPTYQDRAEMLDVGCKFFPVDYLELQIRRAAWFKLNTYHLHLSDWSAFRIESKRFPGLAAEQHYTQAQIRQLVAYAKQYHVTIVPEVDIPAHSVAISHFAPALALHCDSMSSPHPVPWEGADVGGWTLDVTKPATREFVAQLLDEMIPLFDGPYFHVGGDEIPYDDAKAACPELVAYAKQKGLRYPNDAFIEFTNWLDAVVTRHGKTMQVWQWWDYKQQHSLEPAKDILVNQWLGGPTERLRAGYQVIDTDDAVFYECPGLRTLHPGDYCYADPRAIYNYAYTHQPNLHGYKYSRWNDGAQDMSIEFLDQRARSTRVAFADRVWGGPRYGSVDELLSVAGHVGDVDDHSYPGLSQVDAKPGQRTNNARK